MTPDKPDKVVRFQKPRRAKPRVSTETPAERAINTKDPTAADVLWALGVLLEAITGPKDDGGGGKRKRRAA